MFRSETRIYMQMYTCIRGFHVGILGNPVRKNITGAFIQIGRFMLLTVTPEIAPSGSTS